VRLTGLCESLAAAALLAGTAAAQAEPQQQQSLYAGAAHLFNLDRVTVVYPGAPESRAAVNRDSALLRAAFLRLRHGVETAVAADREIGEEQLRGHLLLLGWDNALLDVEGSAPLFPSNDGGRSFLGSRLATGDDVLLMHVSPHNPDRYLAFWSRIDPERDRLEPFPFLGSDWGIYRDYFVVEQGMFEAERSWPPRRHPDAFRRLEHPVLPARSVSPHYTLFAEPALAEPDAAAILAARERALSAALGWLGDSGEGLSISLFVYPDRQQKQTRSGNHTPVHSIPSRAELHMIESQARTAGPHEEIHIVAARRFGPCSLTVLFEGLALSLESDDLAVYAASLAEQGTTPSFELLFDDEQLRELSQRSFAFATAGLFVRWMESIDGGLLARVYSARRSSAASEIARALGKTVPQAEAAFREWIARTGATAQEELAFRKAVVEARAHDARGDLDRRSAALERALALRPEDESTRYHLALSQLEALDYPAAERNLRRLAQTAHPETSPFAALSHYQLGRLYELQGKRGRALDEYRKALALPDRDETHRKAREAIANPLEKQDG
jgi:tetratricopeptide (TPR) repeat protein